ncbi:MAG: GWxTD domain-containing protein [Bacteroidota bacterium]
MLRSLLVIFLAFYHFSSLALDFGRTNVAYLYSPVSPVQIGFELVPAGPGRVTCYLNVKERVRAQYQMSFFTQASYDADDETYFVPDLVDTLTAGESTTVIRCDLSTDSLDAVLVVELIRGSDRYYFPFTADVQRLPSFYPWDDGPVTDYYVKRPPDLRGSDSLFAYAYSMDFGLADPPFGVMKALSPEIEIDSVFRYDKDAAFEDWVFYFIQEDTSSSIGRGFLKSPSYYPRYRAMEELVGPLQYICSSKEFEEILTASSLRQGFQDFWLTTVGNEQQAKIAIRRYYRGVTGANRYFTNYKPGWKTDQGMIYLIFGPPQEVYRTQRKELWKYGGGLQFEFIKISTLFAPSLYTLLRDPDYRDKWAQKIASIRQGS